MQTIWNRIEIQLKVLAPEIWGRLQPGATAAFGLVEQKVGVELPEEVKACYRIHDGQAGEMMDGWSFLSLKGMWYWWRIMMSDLGYPESTRYNPYFPCPTQERYPALWHPQWLPFMKHMKGPMYCIDLAPGPNGRRGQILFHNDRHRDYPDLVEAAPSIRVVASRLEEFFASLATDLEAGKYTFDEATGILWSQEMRLSLPEDFLEYLKSKPKRSQRNTLIASTISWDDHSLNEELRTGDWVDPQLKEHLF